MLLYHRDHTIRRDGQRACVRAKSALISDSVSHLILWSSTEISFTVSNIDSLLCVSYCTPQWLRNFYCSVINLS